MLWFYLQLQLKVNFCAQLSVHVWPKTCIHYGSTMGRRWNSGVNNSKMTTRHRTKLTKERWAHVLMSSTTQNQSKCPKTYRLRCNRVTWRSPKIDIKALVLGKNDPLTQKKQNFAIKWFVRITIHVFLPSFMELCKAELTVQNYAWYSIFTYVFPETWWLWVKLG